MVADDIITASGAVERGITTYKNGLLHITPFVKNERAVVELVGNGPIGNERVGNERLVVGLADRGLGSAGSIGAGLERGSVGVAVVAVGRGSVPEEKSVANIEKVVKSVQKAEAGR